MNHDVFISYKRANKELVFPIVKHIEEKLNVRCWVDLEGIESSAQFASVICNAIDSAKVVLFMHSSIHLNIDFETDWTIKELNYAQAKKKRIVLVKLDSSPLDNIFLMEYGSKNNIDSRDQAQMQKLLKDLSNWLKLSTSESESSKDTTKSETLTDNNSKELMRDGTQALPSTGDVDLKETKMDTSVASPSETTEDENEAAVKNRNTNVPHLIQKGGKYGFTDENGKMIIACVWKEISKIDYINGVLCVRNDNDRWGLLDANGHEIAPCIWIEHGHYWHEAFARVRNGNGKWGAVDRKGDIVILYAWDDMLDIREGLFPVKGNDGKWGFVNERGKLVIPCKWDGVHSFYNGYAEVKNHNGKRGYINKKGEIVVPCKWDGLRRWRKCIMVEMKTERSYDVRHGFIDWTGKTMCSCDLIMIADTDSAEGLTPVEDKYGKWGYVNDLGKLVIPCKWISVGRFYKGKAKVQRPVKKWGIIDTNKYEWVYIDKTGAYIE